MAEMIKDASLCLKDMISKFLPNTEEILVRSGYFYFSGYELIQKELKDKKIRILCGMGTDSKTSNLLSSTQSEEIQNEWCERTLKKIQETSDFASPASVSALETFVRKAKEGTLEVRFDPSAADHTKTFIFNYNKENNQGGITPGVAIGGSSNFTLSGLTKSGQLEGNYLFRDTKEVEDHNELFEKKWKESTTELLGKETFDKFNKKVYKKTFIGQNPTPYELFLKVLNTYYPLSEDKNIQTPSQLTNGKYSDYLYQTDAIEKTLDILHKHNGAIVADVVGLGKSIIAAAVAKNLNINTLTICKPASEKDWNEYKTEFGVDGRVISKGMLHKVLKNRGEYLKDTDQKENQNLIIIDEAHEFRNDKGTEYSKLHEICSGNMVLLLTATPMSNKPEDTFSLIKLFQEPDMTTLQTIDSLSETTKEIFRKWKHMVDSAKKASSVESKTTSSDKEKDIEKLQEEIDNMMRLLVEPLLIRRSRIDLEFIKRYDRDLKIQGIEFPIVREPILSQYSIDHVEDKYEQTLTLMSKPQTKGEDIEKNRFIGARYMAQHPDYLEPAALTQICKKFSLDEEDVGNAVTQENLADMMRRLVSRRFESSMPAFMHTLKSILQSSKLIMDWYNKLGIVPVYKRADAYLPDLDDMIDDEGKLIDNVDDDINLDKLKSKGGWWIEKKFLKDKFKNLLVSDINHLQSLHDSWQSYLDSGKFIDTKLDELNKILDKELSLDDERKVVIFTEYVDTANYLYDKLNAKYPTLLFRATETSQPSKIDDLKYNFDAGVDKQRDDFRLLIATDTIAEGKNLHRAGTVINYDLPYNPTKVVQRIGRINRISKKMFNELHIYNFFPTKIGEDATNIKTLTGIKKKMFNAIYGDDTKTLTGDETLKTYLTDKTLIKEEISTETKYSNLIWELREKDPDLINKINSIANKAFIKRYKKQDKGLVCFTEKQGQPRFRFLNEAGELINLTIEKYLKIFNADRSECSMDLTNDSHELFKKIDEENLFNQKVSSKESNRNKREVIKNIEHLLQDSRENKISATKIEYLEDLLFVIKDLGSLPPYRIKEIKKLKISKNSYSDENFFDRLTEIARHYYLKSRRIKADYLKNSPESIIIREHLNDL